MGGCISPTPSYVSHDLDSNIPQFDGNITIDSENENIECFIPVQTGYRPSDISNSDNENSRMSVRWL